MKKIISIILAVSMVFSLVFFSFTASADSVRYGIKYDNNGGSGFCYDYLSYSSGENAFALFPDGLSYKNREFVGWNTEPRGNGIFYAPGDPVLIDNSDVTLYAIWTPCNDKNFNVIYSNNFANGYWNSIYESYAPGSKVQLSDCPFNNSGYDFVGWNTSPYGNGISFQNNATIYSLNEKILNYDSDSDGCFDSFNLYAQWKKISGSDTITREGMVFSNDMKTLLACPVTREGKVTVPSSVNEIYGYAFCNCTKVTEIVLPEGVKYLDNYAFFGCTSLASINLPKSIVSLGDWCFGKCTALSSIDLYSNATTMGNCAFAGCTELRRFSNSSNISKYSKGVFSGCIKLKDLNFSSSVNTIEEYAFYGCVAFTEFGIPTTVKRINCYAFKDCKNIFTLWTHNGLYVEYGAFDGCNVKRIEPWGNISEITSNMMICPDTVDYFYFSSNISRVDKNAFSHMKNLCNISIDDSVTYIADGAFDSCNNVTLSGYSSYVEQYAGKNNYPLIMISKDSVSASVVMSADTASHIVIPKSYYGLPVTSIYQNAFANKSKLKSVVIPSSVKTVESGAFSGCSSLSSVQISAGVTTISDYAFANTAIKSVVIPATVVSLSSTAFYGCEDITIIFDNSLKGNVEELTPDKILLGNVTGTGIISADDSLIALQASIGKTVLTEEQFFVLDVNRDNVVTSIDAFIILRMSLGISDYIYCEKP